jgi:hypothetical protein
MRALVAACALSLLFVVGGVEAANPLGIAFKYVTNVPQYAKPTGMLITGRCNRYDAAFAAARQ